MQRIMLSTTVALFAAGTLLPGASNNSKNLQAAEATYLPTLKPLYSLFKFTTEESATHVVKIWTGIGENDKVRQDGIFVADEETLGFAQAQEYRFFDPDNHVVGYIADSPAPGLVPLYQLFKDGDHEYCTTDICKGHAEGSGYAFEGIIGYLAKNKSPQTRAMHRFLRNVNGKNLGHIYPVTDLDPAAIGVGSARYEGILGYVWKNPTVISGGSLAGVAEKLTPRLILNKDMLKPKSPLGLTPVLPGSATITAVDAAANKLARQSSISSGGAASFAVDGNTDGDFKAHSVSSTAEEYQPWWQVDLGEAMPVARIEVWNRTDCCSEKLANFAVFVSEQPFKSADPNVTLRQDGVSAFLKGGKFGTEASESYAIAPVPRGRYVRIQLLGSGILSLAEVKIFAR